MVDTGSYVEILFSSPFRQINLKKIDLEPYSAPLVRFDGQPTLALGKIKLPMSLGPVTLMVNFLVVEASFPYNAILGRGWIHKIKIVPSTYHQCLRFPTPKGLMKVQGEQALARKCYALAIKVEQQQSIP